MKTQNSKTATTITAETGGEKPTAAKLSFDDIQARSARAFRRSLFVPGFPETNTAAIRTCFGMDIEYLSAATLTLDEWVFGDMDIRSCIEMMLIKPQEKLLVTVHVFRAKQESVVQTYETRVVHCANRLGDEEYEENADYETTQVYLASGVLNDHAKAIFAAEHAGLEKYAREHLRRGREVNPFCQWQFSR